MILLSSHTSGRVDGALGEPQRHWLATALQTAEQEERFVLVGLHHPPLSVGEPSWDQIGLRDAESLQNLLSQIKTLRGVVVGHLHQHWQDSLPGRADVPVMACPSTLCAFEALQPCPLGRSQDPGARLLELDSQGCIQTTLLRWSEP